MGRMKNQIEAVSIAIQAAKPINLIGNPGIGKTSIARAIARSLEIPIEVVLAANKEPTDFGGFPIDTPEGLVMRAPAWAKQFDENTWGDKPAIVFLDEVNQAPMAVQAVLMTPVLEGKVGECQMGPRVARVMAMNPASIATNGYNLSAAFSNRMCHLPFEFDYDYWMEGGILGWPDPQLRKLPVGWESLIPAARNLFFAFARVKRTIINVLPKTEEEMGGPWPSARSWEMAWTLKAAAEAVGANTDVTTMLVSGVVGPGPALEWLGYLEELDLPDTEECLKNPKKFTLPDRGDRQWAALGSITAAVIGQNTAKRWEAALTIFGLCAEKAPDIAAMNVKALGKIKPKGATTPPEILKFLPLLKITGAI